MRDAARRLLGLPWLEPLTALLLRARTVRPAAGFALRELARVRVTRVYRLRTSGLRVAIRHRSADPVTLGEVFHELDYEPPAELAARLDLAGLSILDLGANIGLFGAFALARWPASRLVAYEPDPGNAAVHRATIAANGSGERWTLVEAAAGAADGELSFVAGMDSLSHAVGVGVGIGDTAGSTITVALVDVLDAVAGADLVKIDIEGGEWPILADPRFAHRPPAVLVMEYHPDGCPGPDALAAATAALSGAGMTVRPFRPGAAGHGMLWAWRT